MSYKFKISSEIDQSYGYNYKLKDQLIFNYSRQDYFHEYSNQTNTVICFGYCFDIRKPQENSEKTLEYLVNADDFKETINYINGHYIIIKISDKEVTLYTDASLMTPVYFSKKFGIVTNNYNSDLDLLNFNPNYKLDLINFSIDRFYTLNNFREIETEKLYDNFTNLLRNQFKYFIDRNLNILFQADNYHKAIFAVLGSGLAFKNIVVRRFDDKGLNTDFGKQFSKEFHLNYYEMQDGEEGFPLVQGSNYLARNNLSNFKAIYLKENTDIDDEKIIETYSINEENREHFNYEFNLIANYIKSNIELSKDFLLYEPLNARILLNIFIELNKREDFNANLFIIGELKPSLNFYNFTNGKNLREVNLQLKNENLDLKSNSISAQNQKFLMNTKLSNFSVSQNLDGKLKKEEILIYPAKQKIKKGTEYILEYKNIEDGLIFIESFYKNEKNARRIQVIVNNEKYNIYDFYQGRYFYTDENLKIIIKYTQDYDHLSWQKAGTIKVKKIK